MLTSRGCSSMPSSLSFIGVIFFLGALSTSSSMLSSLCLLASIVFRFDIGRTTLKYTEGDTKSPTPLTRPECSGVPSACVRTSSP